MYPKIETGCAFTKDMNIEFVKKINTGNFTQGSAVLKIQNYSPKNLNILHLAVKEHEKTLEYNRMRNG